MDIERIADAVAVAAARRRGLAHGLAMWVGRGGRGRCARRLTAEVQGVRWRWRGVTSCTCNINRR